MSVKRIGVYSGSFDPIHRGHIAFAELALQACSLHSVVFLPEAEPRGKPNVSPLDQRYALIQAATQHNDRLRAMLLPSKQFTVEDTLVGLNERFPGAQLTLLVGSDIVPTFRYRWPGVKTLLSSVELAIGLRNDDTAEEMKAIITSLEKAHGVEVLHRIVATPHGSVSSSLLRRSDERNRDRMTE